MVIIFVTVLSVVVFRLEPTVTIVEAVGSLTLLERFVSINDAKNIVRVVQVLADLLH